LIFYQWFKLELCQACKDLYHAKGIRGFWLGYLPSISRDVPFSAIYWGTYEGIKKLYRNEKDPSMLFSFCAGATAGSVSSKSHVVLQSDLLIIIN